MQIYPKSKESGVQNMATDWWLFETADKPSLGIISGPPLRLVLGMVKIGSGWKR